MASQTADDIARSKRLAFAKYLYGGARERLQSPSELAAADALLRLHDSVEVFQAVVLDKFGLPKKQRGGFMEFWQQVESETKYMPPYQDRFRALNDMRAALKHHATLPNLEELRELVAVVPSFFDGVASKLLNVDFQSVSLADWIENSDVREHIKHGNAGIVSGDYPRAVSEFAQAFTILDGERNAGLPPYLISTIGLFRHERIRSGDVELALKKAVRDQTPEGVSKLFQRLQAQIDELKEVIDALVWGTDLQRYKRFKYLTPIVNRAASGVMEVIQHRQLPLAEDDAHFCLQFVLDTALSIQRRKFSVPDPYAP